MCCASAKSLLRLVLIGGLVLFGGSARLMAEEAPAKADAEAASTSEAGVGGHPEDHGADHGGDELHAGHLRQPAQGEQHAHKAE